MIKIFTTIHFKGDDQFIEVTVKDNGPGMTMTQLMEVFNPVRRAVTSPSQYVSNGVGLSICKKICE